ncbi:agmatinase [Acidaminobacter hydrogenoformans]|uniref:Agmatinase n=1 Tax=Acidaminobacter hydrogenoformans DSM 2784 TaxID=1120920 RepID=A0A1G5S7W1_9FIRM|nr:agmatinase [Acidaminobacter hydrogenoformans]SCZ81709.1 agmatinase [Acidaminobacter hydrogenoformans DSM 2784]
MDKFIGFESTYEEAQLVLFGIPYDGTTSFRPGTRFGPAAVRQDSFGIETYSPYFDQDLEDYKLCDLGDIELTFGNAARVMDTIEAFARPVAEAGKKIFSIGGEHLVTYPVFKAVFEKYPDLAIVHLDAHTDLREDYMGEKLSHASVIKRIWDHVGDASIYQFGIRSGLKEEFEWAKSHTYLEKFTANTLPEIVKQIGQRPVYLTVDLDVLDPSIFSGTGTPEPGGLTFNALIEALKAMKGLNIVAADAVELAPHYDHSGVSTAVACKLVREMTLLML